MLASLLVKLVSVESVNAFLAARDIPAPEDHEKAINLAVRASGAKSQNEVAALVVNLTQAKITGSELTEVLKAAFPKDKVGERHGPYYLSLARTGKLKVDFVPAKKANTVKATAVDPRVGQLEAEISKLREELRVTTEGLTDETQKRHDLEVRIAKALESTSAKDIKAALNG